MTAAAEVIRPAREELADLVSWGFTDRQIAEHYNVHAKTVIGWRRKYKITRQYAADVRLPWR